ncbi:hypothetical protein SmJEL517_g02097 [Synchytrium microbalum]|uniref:Presequence translocated-associated motor subunit PAM17 n=1 Tax=Synchytrium microbalum TaxID=1806994 RepID=A0A507CC16_9FUNG|nr:uncharacterized protein SmJEL517_g02097 [Synchytrium microbalum]TPX35484.1 hypothetical protein SmJEL517_g02097 [Synchytrium microbalum]
MSTVAMRLTIPRNPRSISLLSTCNRVICSNTTQRHQPYASASNPTSTAAEASATSSTIPSSKALRSGITWTQYFTMRHQRKTYERTGGILGATVGFLGGTFYFGAVADFDPTTPIMGIDPAIAFTLGAMGVAGGALVAGILGGGSLWRLMHGKVINAIDARDKEFFDRVKRYRSDASKSSPQNQIPDYYGEKIKSLSEYRQWLRKQRQFRRKAEIKVPL